LRFTAGASLSGAVKRDRTPKSRCALGCADTGNISVWRGSFVGSVGP
jgi:hypothetical protein